jgi:hypothetical protein
MGALIGTDYDGGAEHSGTLAAPTESARRATTSVSTSSTIPQPVGGEGVAAGPRARLTHDLPGFVIWNV